MLKLPEKFKIMLLSMAYGMMMATPAIADDTEIYTSAGSVSTAVQANVLFVLDTSGSMGTTVTTRVAYDPSVTYVAAGCYQSNRVYLLPRGSSRANRHCNGGSWWYPDVSKLSQVYRSAFVCDAAKSIDTTGYYTTKFSQYRGGWQDSMTNNNLSSFVECKGDQGIHGQATGDGKPWAVTKNGPWSSSSNNKVIWNNTGFDTTLYSGNYLNYLVSTPLTQGDTRIGVMQQVISDLVTNTTGINIGLMRFSNDADGGMVAEPIDDIETNRTAFITELNKMTASGGTPLSESLYESAMYYQGSSVDYGLNSQPFASVAGSRSGNIYKSPITNECQKNFTILLTDGDPTSDSVSGTRLTKVGVSSCSGNCLDEIAGATASNDQSSLAGDQVISTYTIGFTTAQQLLEDTATASKKASGVGKYLTADDASTLADAFNAILIDINKSDTTFSSPAVSVNAFNRSTHLDNLYFTLFKPAVGGHWAGNLKKYKLDFFIDTKDVDGDKDITERLPFIADATGADAVDPITGFFGTGSTSIWTTTGTDGKDVAAGGAANQFDTATRKVYTYADTYTNDNGVLRPGVATAPLTAATNLVRKTNTGITDVMLGIVGEPEAITGTPRIETLLEWAAGFDVFNAFGTPGTTGDARMEMGDPLHSEPALVQYGGTVTTPDLVAYVATNDGYLHAFDVDDGKEIFSFIPQELLPNLNPLMVNDVGDKIYGLDGNVVAWVNDINEDGIINGTDHVYLYVGMRRGGDNIYSLDVTDRNNPVLRWVIEGGTGDYQELGQTWSTVNVEKIKDGASEKTVLIFGGGYDTNQDNVTVRTQDSVGRAVFIADAESGDLLWSAGPGGTQTVANMDYSIPARVKPLDMSGDGLTDRLYVADMGGQIFRFDIDNDNGSALSGSITGGRIADLAGSAEINARRFYYPPDVALIAKRGKAAYLAVVAGSGYRAHPLNTKIQDRMYLVKDKDVYNTPTSYTTLTEADLYDATLNLVAGDGTAAQQAAAKTALGNTEGWFIKLDDEAAPGTWIGEKVLAEPLIIEGTAVITTFTPIATSVTTSCAPQAGTGKVFYLDVFDGSPAFPSNLDKRPERHKALARSGIPPTPNVVITKGGEPTLCIGTECEAADFGLGVRKTYWYEVEK